MKNLHSFIVRYIGPTNHRPSRIKITSPRFNQSVFIPFNHQLNNPADMAEAYLTAQGFNIVAQAEALNGTDIVLSDTFKPLKEDGWKKGDAQAYTRSIAKTLAAARFIRYESRRASHAIA